MKYFITLRERIIKKVFIFIFSLLLMNAAFLYAQEASVKWSLIENQKVTAVVGHVIGFEQTLSNMVVSEYKIISNTFNTQITTIKGGIWPKEITQNKNRYIQFKVSTKPGTNFQIDNLSMYYTGKGGSNMKINIAFSTDSNFTTSTEVNSASSPISISSDAGLLQLITFNLNAVINSTQSFYLRIYPWYTLELSNKFVCLQNVTLSGLTTGTAVPVLPFVTTSSITDISTESAVCGGNILSDGDGRIISRGVCWSKNKFPTIDDSKTNDGIATGTYVSLLSGLEKDTKYYVRAYVTNNVGTSYGNLDSLITRNELSQPEIITLSEIKVIGTSATCQAIITNWGGTTIIERGFCYNSSGNPTVDDNKVIDKSGFYSFTSILFSLTRNTKYFLRAYAKNNLGLSYGEEREFFIASPLKGTYADGIHKDTKAIQAAIDSCSAAGGGTVLFADGHYLTAPFEVKSDVTIKIDSTAIIYGSKDAKDYYKVGADTTLPPTSLRPLITSNNAQNITFTGKGKIDGNGQIWWPNALVRKASGASDVRPQFIQLNRTQNLLIENITLLNSPMWNLIPHYCKHVTIRNLYIKSPADSPNTDGIDPSMSHDVFITNCIIDVGDDNVAIKVDYDDPSYPDEGSSDIWITNCTFLHGHGMSIGSPTVGGLRNVSVEDCTFKYTDIGLRIKSDRDRGGNVRGVTFKNITMDSVTYAIQFSEYYPTIPAQTDAAQSIISTTPYFHDITVLNMTATNSKYAGLIIGLPEKFIDNITMKNVTISSTNGLTIRNASVNFINSQINVITGDQIIYQRNGTVTGIAEESKSELPQKFSLSQNYPNPFNPETVISYQLPVDSYVTLKVYDVLGREVITLVDEFQNAGIHNSQFSTCLPADRQGSQLCSGVYFYRIKAGNFSQVKKMILLK